ncbi:MAG: hypothetical protein AVDCRST_MAG64-2876, partial [uncultured Phycisphaerae bacterium]
EKGHRRHRDRLQRQRPGPLGQALRAKRIGRQRRGNAAVGQGRPARRQPQWPVRPPARRARALRGRRRGLPASRRCHRPQARLGRHRRRRAQRYRPLHDRPVRLRQGGRPLVGRREAEHAGGVL